tara:strand:+ start:1390 stop:2493 length:1104 start_codon:yes stop_codon:yes gene_type:complete
MKKFLFFDPGIVKLLKNPRYPSGGATVQALCWARALRKKGYDVGIISNEIVQINSEFELIYTYKESQKDSKLLWINYKYEILKEKIISYNPDYVYQAGAGFVTWVVSSIARNNNIKFIHRIANDVDTDRRIKKRLGVFNRAFYLNGLKGADIVLCQNMKQLFNLRKYYQIKNAHVLHNPIEIVRGKNFNVQKSKYIAWLGIFQFQKNLPGLYKIAKSLPMYRFAIGGDINPANKDLQVKKCVEKLKGLPNVIFKGYIDRSQISNFLSEAYILLNTSHFEGFSNTFLESWKAGTPVFSLKSVDPDDVISKHKLGLTFDRISDFSSSIIEFIEGDKKREYSDRCFYYVSQHHSDKDLVNKFLSKLDVDS